MSSDLPLEQIKAACPPRLLAVFRPSLCSSHKAWGSRGCIQQLRRSTQPTPVINSSSRTENVLPPSFLENFSSCIRCGGYLHLRTKRREGGKDTVVYLTVLLKRYFPPEACSVLRNRVNICSVGALYSHVGGEKRFL